MNGVNLKNIRYSDDTVFETTAVKNVQKLLDVVIEEIEKSKKIERECDQNASYLKRPKHTSQFKVERPSS